MAAENPDRSGDEPDFATRVTVDPEALARQVNALYTFLLERHPDDAELRREVQQIFEEGRAKLARIAGGEELIAALGDPFSRNGHPEAAGSTPEPERPRLFSFFRRYRRVA